MPEIAELKSHLDHKNTESQRRNPDRNLLIYLRVIGGLALLAFLASVMPASWIVQVSEELGFDPFPDSPLTFYLARNLSLLYGFVGASLLVLASDLERYRPLIRYASFGTILFAVFQCIVDSMAALPAWWTWGESGSTFVGGSILFWLQRDKQ